MNKRGIFFSADALISLVIILLLLVIAFPLLEIETSKTNIHEDTLVVLSSLKIGEINNSYVKSLISAGEIEDLEKPIIEQIGIFYAENLTLAKKLTEEVLSDINTNENIGIWYDNILLGSKNKTSYENAERVEVARQTVSGIGGLEENTSTGYSARAYLTSALQTTYFYFGGYIGEGNISAILEYNGTIKSAELELTTNSDFFIFVNNVSLGKFNKSETELKPARYNLSTSQFFPGKNIFEIRGSSIHISGGFVKLSYYDKPISYEQSVRHYFPGVHGLINIYDGFYIPGDLDSMNVFLHMNSSHNAFLNIGNVTVFNGSTNGEQSISLGNSALDSLLDYNSLSRKTIPLRLGLENLSYAVNISLDVISVSDLSKSMSCSVAGGNCGNGPGQCSACGGAWLLPLNKSKEAHYLLVDKILELSKSKVGIKGYHVSVPTSADVPLTNNSAQLNSAIQSWDDQTLSSQNRRLCLAIQSAAQDFQTNSQEGNIKVAIVMSAGSITHGCGVTAGDLNFNGVSNDPGDEAIKVTCDEHTNKGIIFHSVGYGANADVQTLQKIAECGNGTFYSSDIAGLPELYDKIIEDIKAEYSLQTLDVVSGNILTRIYPDSYIEFGYDKSLPDPGLILSFEKNFSNSTHGNFSIPPNSKILETRVVSYSGPKWTDKAYINNNKIYDIVNYGQAYIRLGDPYAIDIPNSQILENNAVNIVNVSTGISPGNSSVGSIFNKIIYTISRNVSIYSDVVYQITGCNWFIEFEDGSNASITIPSEYLGSDNCIYSNQSGNYNDAAKISVESLFNALDLDMDGKLDYKFLEDDVEIQINELSGIPFVESRDIQVRIWR